MKSLKYDSESIDLSSYDIVSIAYNIPSLTLSLPKEKDLAILAACLDYCHTLRDDPQLRSSITVPDEHRKVFAAGHATNTGLMQLTVELERLTTDVLRENQRSFRKLAEARVDY